MLGAGKSVVYHNRSDRVALLHLCLLFPKL